MERLFQLLFKLRNALLFLILEIISLLFLFNNNRQQQEVYLTFVQDLAAEAQVLRTDFFAYFNLKNENEKLLYHNQKLREAYLKIKSELETYKYFLPLKPEYRLIPDSLMPKNGFRFIPCQVINNTLERSYNYLTLNKGYKNGIQKGMGIITDEGVMGMIIAVSENHSVAMSILNKNFRLSAKIFGENFFGSISWKGGNPAYATLEYIPLHVDIRKGDTIVTSGFSSIFPEGYMIGTIDDFEENNEDGFYEISVKLNSAPGKAWHVYALANVYRNEIDTLEAQTKIFQ
jgi:rod shape-determining protein MreC